MKKQLIALLSGIIVTAAAHAASAANCPLAVVLPYPTDNTSNEVAHGVLSGIGFGTRNTEQPVGVQYHVRNEADLQKVRGWLNEASGHAKRVSLYSVNPDGNFIDPSVKELRVDLCDVPASLLN